MRKMGVAKSKNDVRKLIKEVDKDGNGTIEFDEFLWMVKKLQESGAMSSTGGGGFTSMIGGAIGKANVFSGMFAKKKFDTEAYAKQQAARSSDTSSIENKYLSKQNRKALEKKRRQRAKTFGGSDSK
eukprot:TRINITY_DN23_c0_g1_i3.p2 TRINITY_DN23_c0_g1~~TRINITY_DN23_c0_g1_i3.p2  ORF type:complete len:127 (-),score=52.75 TRINITY_DN23_c0_g1_i3:633-1013(-)